jgi:uncharacterized protein DUF4382
MVARRKALSLPVTGLRLFSVLSASKAYLYVGMGLLLIALCLLPGSTIANENNTGIFEVRIKDHREAIDDFAKLTIAVDKIQISPKAGLRFWQTGWKEFATSTNTIDLTRHVGNKTALIFRREIQAGSFDAFDLKITNIAGVLKKTRRAEPVKNTVGPIKLAFEVPAKGETVLVLDLVVTDFSDHPPQGYELGMKGYELYINKKLVEKIPPG